MPYARRRRPGLLNTVARTAVITGTASATANAVGRRADGQAVEQQQAAAFRAQQAVPAPAPAPTAGGPDLVAQLGELARLRDAGALTESEFDGAKAKLLGR